jgi:hypothetical protein
VRNKKEKAVKTPNIALLNILTIVMAFVMLVSIVRLISEMRSAFVRDRYHSMEYTLKEEDYAGMVSDYYRWNYDVDPFSTPNEEEYQVSAYADAAFRYKLFSAAGEDGKREYWQQRMEQAREKTGSLSVSADEVDRLLDNVPQYK